MWVIITHIFYYIPSVGQLITSPIANERPVSSSPLPVCFHQPISDDAHAVCGVYRQMARCKTHFRDISSPNSPPRFPIQHIFYLIESRRRDALPTLLLVFILMNSNRSASSDTHTKNNIGDTHTNTCCEVFIRRNVP